MADKESLSAVGVIKIVTLSANSVNSPAGLGIDGHFAVPKQEQNDDFDKVKEVNNADAEKLFKHIPELKDIFRIKAKIGEGTFSNVYLAHYIEDPDVKLFALKHITPTSAPDRVEREVRCLQEMGGKNNVIGYKGTLRNHDHSAVILPYFPHDKFQDYLKDMTVADIQDYMRNLLLALQHIHRFSIIHRDIKPGNFLHSRNLKRYNLVDFGLAMHEPGSEKAWEIEKKKGNNAKKVTTKNVRLLSPECCKNNPKSKKSRTSPRVSIPSHKFTRQTSALSLKSSLKQSHVSGNSQIDKKHTKEDTKSVSKSGNGHQKTHGGKSASLRSSTASLRSSTASSGLCETNHKRVDICSLCIKRSSQNAPRAGTSGFRAPEVLMKHPNQTTAVDVWSTGVIMLCLLSGRYPFFRCYDDMTALAQLISLFGKQRVMESSKQLGKYMVCKSSSIGFDLKTLCQKLRMCSGEKSTRGSSECCTTCVQRSPRGTPSRTSNVPRLDSGNSTSNGETKVRFLSSCHSTETTKTEEVAGDEVREHLDGSQCNCHCGSCSRYLPRLAYDLLEKFLDLNPATRITASEALNHPFLTNKMQINDTEDKCTEEK